MSLCKAGERGTRVATAASSTGATDAANASTSDPVNAFPGAAETIGGNTSAKSSTPLHV